MVDGIRFEIALDALTLRLPEKVKDGVCKFCDQPTNRNGLFCLSCLPLNASLVYPEYHNIYALLHSACGFNPTARRPTSKLNVPKPPKPKPPKPAPELAACAHCGAMFEKLHPNKLHCSKSCGWAVNKLRTNLRKNPDYKPQVLGICRHCGDQCEKYVCKSCKARNNRATTTKGVCRKCGKTCKFYVCDVCQYEMIRKDRKKYRKRLQGVKSEPYTHNEIAERDGWRCQLCRKMVNKRLKYPHPMCASIDHIVPISKGGTDVRVNVQLAHLVCNVSKGNRTVEAGEQLRLLG